MYHNRLLANLKADLQISSDAYNDYLEDLLGVAENAIKREGIKLGASASDEDETLVIMYAAYLYRSRRGGGDEMPRSLRCILNDKLFSQKAGEGK